LRACRLLIIIIIRLHADALVKSIEFRTTFEPNPSNYPTYAEMATSSRRKRINNIPFICVPYNVGSTTHFNPRLANSQKKSFGCPRYFFRLNLTSAIQQVPFAYVDWCVFTARMFEGTCFEGHMSRREWTTGPSFKERISPFVTMDDFVPSRFVMAYETGLDVAFLALDPERVSECSDDGRFVDVGDNALANNKDAMRTFLMNRM
jgi:hypothetical protein